jgi:hypothetical protein
MTKKNHSLISSNEEDNFFHYLKTPQSIQNIQNTHMYGFNLGSDANSIPLNKILSISSSIVKKYIFNQPPEYYDGNGRLLKISEIFHSVLLNGGGVSIEMHTNYKINGGKITGFSIYGQKLNELIFLNTKELIFGHFGYPTSTEIISDIDGPSNFIYYYSNGLVVDFSLIYNRIDDIHLNWTGGVCP